MKILRVADVPDNRTGGMSRSLYGTGDVLQRLGHRVDNLFREHIKVTVPEKLRRFAVPLSLVPLISKRHELVEYDVVEIHEPLAAAYCVARRRDPNLPPLVVFSHGLEDNGHAAELRYLRLKGLGPSLKQRWSPLTVVWQAVYSVKHADHVVCLNSQDFDHLIRQGVSRERITALHSGVDEAFLSAGERVTRQPDAGRDSAILFLGTWILRKGILDIVDAVTIAFRQSPQARLTIAGCHVDRDTVLARFPSDCRSRIEVIPHLANSQAVADILARHSILLLPSFYEGHPIAMIEAAALRLAIVTTSICGMADFVKDRVNGRFVNVGDGAQLAEVVLELLADRDQRERLGAAALETAKRHTWAAAADRLLGAYRHAAHCPGRDEERTRPTRAGA